MANKILTLNGNLLISGGNAIQVDVGGGGSVNLQEKTDINPTTSSQTIAPDSGYDGLSSVQINAMPSGSAGTPTATKGTPANNQVSVTPSVTNTTGYITGGTISGTPVIITSPEITTFKMGVIRPDAEVVKTWSWDDWAVEDLELTIPSYSTSAQTLQTGSAFSETYTGDFTNYDYFIVERFLTIPKYAEGTGFGKGRVEYATAAYTYEIISIMGNTFYAISDPTKVYTSRTANLVASAYTYRSVYWSSASAITAYSTAAYTTAQTAVAPTYSSSKITVSSSTKTMRGNTTYFVNTYFNAIEDIRYQGIIELYRAPKNNYNLNAWGATQVLTHIANCVHNNNGTLT